MAGWVRRRLSAVRTRLRQRLDLLLEFIVLRHQLAVLQRTGARRLCFRPSERLLWVFPVSDEPQPLGDGAGPSLEQLLGAATANCLGPVEKTYWLRV